MSISAADLQKMSASPHPPKSAGGAGSLDDKLSNILGSSQFTVASYLNTALSDSRTSEEELQQRMAELALQLQLQTQSCHEEIGKIGAELQAILPRCAADVGRVGVGLEGMKMDAQSLIETTRLHSNEEEVSSSLETLGTLHALQANLGKTKSVLTAAATWDSTLSSIPPLLAKQQLSEAVNALATLEHGERALRGMPHPEEREEQIAKIRQQVSVMLQPQLKTALSNMNTRLGPLQQCVELYSKLGKMDSLQEEYVKNRPGPLHKTWFDFHPSYEKESSDLQQQQQADSTTNPKETFGSWLPGWYDSALSLLTEERRQSLSVFGPALSPEIMVKVLRECFRPILPSFISRLESVYSSSIAAPANKGSFESLCSIYEATLRFLSVSYELVAGTFLDASESGSVKQDDNGMGLFQDMVDVFVQVAAPFAKYQERFSQLEIKHSSVATSLIAKDIHQAVNVVSANPSLESVQEATERLKDLAPFIFPMTEGSLDRFELLTGGYLATNAIAAVDKILSGHVGELAIAIRTLSTAMTADPSKLADGFDEQHVLCSMEVLKLAGMFHRDLQTFEGKTRERLGMLSQRMQDYSRREQELQEAKTTSKAKNAFTIPDSMSVVNIDSILTKKTCTGGDDMEDASVALSILQRLSLSPDEGGAAYIYSESVDSLRRLVNSCHHFVFDICSAVPRLHLDSMSSMACWKGVASDDLNSYGTLPQQYITQVGEHMLALVQALEPFASDPEALALANEVMDGLRDVSLQVWSEFAAATGIMASDPVVASLMDSNAVADYVLNNAALAEEDAQLDGDVTANEKASAEFCNKWLDVVGLAVTGRLLERIMRIPQLTPKGCEHLAADLNYLVNVFSALGVAGHPHPLVSHLAELASLSDGDLKMQITGRSKDDPIASAIRAIEARMALLRGMVVH